MAWLTSKVSRYDILLQGEQIEFLTIIGKKKHLQNAFNLGVCYPVRCYYNLGVIFIFACQKNSQSGVLPAGYS